MGQAVFQLDRLIFKHNDDERFIKCTCDNISTTIVNTICNSSQYFSVKQKYYIIKISFILKYNFIIEFLYLYENIEYCNFFVSISKSKLYYIQIGRKVHIIKFIYFHFKIQKNVDKSWKCINIHVYNTMTTYFITLCILQFIK